MYAPLHLGLNHLGPLIVTFAAGMAVMAGLWYLLARADFSGASRRT